MHEHLDLKPLEPIVEFKAVFNPFTREVAVRYGTHVQRIQFTSLDDDIDRVWYNGEYKGNYCLHVAIQWREGLELVITPRVHPEHTANVDQFRVVYTTAEFLNVPEQMVIAHTDDAFTKLSEGWLLKD